MNKLLVITLAFLLPFILLSSGCTWWNKDKDPEEFSYTAPDIPPLVKPQVIPAQSFLRVSPSGHLYNLTSVKIAITSIPGFARGADPKGYLNQVALQAKKQGVPYLPYHYYVSPEGAVYEGINSDFCGYIEDEKITDAMIVGVMGNFSEPTTFMTNDQQNTLIQLLAWVCKTHSLTPQVIVPADQVSPKAAPLGTNLANWFGPTRMLATRVQAVIDADNAPKEDGFFGKTKAQEQEQQNRYIDEEFGSFGESDF